MASYAIPFDRRTQAGAGVEAIEFPETYDEWRGWYTRLEAAYLSGPYSLAESKAYRLFRAFDPNDDILAETRRITRDVQHVVDTAAGAIAGSRMLLALGDGDDGDLDAGRAVWKRSGWLSRKGGWAKWLGMMGRAGLEAVRLEPSGASTVLVARDPRSYRAEYDQETGTRLERVVISVPFYEPGSVDPAQGVVQDQAILHTYIRVLDREAVTVYLDGDLVEEESGAHGLGEVPFVNSICLPYHADDEHGLWAGHGMDSALAFYDSAQTQIAAIGNRYANPQLIGKGVRFGEDSDVSRFGRMIGIPKGAEVGYLEPSFQQLQRLLEAAQAARLAARESLPEFIFAGAGANASGEALRLRSLAFVAKYEEIRERVYADLARVTEYAVRMDAGAAYDADGDALAIEASPVLTPDRGAELAALETADKIGAITRADKVRGLQRLGMLSADLDPDAYAAEIEDRTADRATQFFAATAQEDTEAAPVEAATDLEAIEEGAPVEAATDLEAIEEGAPVAASPATEPAANTALNGAQVAAARDVITAVAVGDLPRETGVAMLVAFFSLPAAVAEDVMGDVGRSFVPASAVEAQEGEA